MPSSSLHHQRFVGACDGAVYAYDFIDFLVKISSHRHSFIRRLGRSRLFGCSILASQPSHTHTLSSNLLSQPLRGARTLSLLRSAEVLYYKMSLCGYVPTARQYTTTHVSAYCLFVRPRVSTTRERSARTHWRKCRTAHSRQMCVHNGRGCLGVRVCVCVLLHCRSPLDCTRRRAVAHAVTHLRIPAPIPDHTNTYTVVTTERSPTDDDETRHSPELSQCVRVCVEQLRRCCAMLCGRAVASSLVVGLVAPRPSSGLDHI